jgi:hypothetical protein
LLSPRGQFDLLDDDVARAVAADAHCAAVLKPGLEESRCGIVNRRF